ncbi:hypothetical protein DFH09DRAFT_1345414 [Mycena vulgaris]|nr:hypothetical protein DFH09DRAFT_1345414 [Mycena vulgaris]
MMWGENTVVRRLLFPALDILIGVLAGQSLHCCAKRLSAPPASRRGFAADDSALAEFIRAWSKLERRSEGYYLVMQRASIPRRAEFSAEPSPRLRLHTPPTMSSFTFEQAAYRRMAIQPSCPKWWCLRILSRARDVDIPLRRRALVPTESKRLAYADRPLHQIAKSELSPRAGHAGHLCPIFPHPLFVSFSHASSSLAFRRSGMAITVAEPRVFTLRDNDVSRLFNRKVGIVPPLVIRGNLGEECGPFLIVGVCILERWVQIKALVNAHVNVDEDYVRGLICGAENGEVPKAVQASRPIKGQDSSQSLLFAFFTI